MKRKYYYFLVVILVLNGYATFAQQNIQFTQYMFNSLSVNPAYAGYKEQWFLQGTARNQWVGFSGAPTTSQVSVDGILNPANKKIGVGLQITSDILGPQSTTSFYANYSYRLQLDDEDTKRLCFGLAAGVTQYTLSGSKLDAIDDNDPTVQNAGGTNYIPDFRFGIYYSSPKWYLGVSLVDMLSSNLLKSDVANEYNIVRHPNMYVIAGSLFELTDYFKFRPGVMYKEDFKGFSVVDLNGMIIYRNRIWLGATYRTSFQPWAKDYISGNGYRYRNAISPIVQFYITDDLRMGYSFDYTINGLQYAQHGTHEVTIGWTIPTRSQRLLSPRFF